MVTGSIATMLYGEPRLTLDIDLVVEIDVEQAQAILDVFPEDEFYRPPLEVLRAECTRDSRGHFNIIEHASGMKADFYLAGRDPLQRWGLQNRRCIAFSAGELFVAPPEYVIVMKLEYWREGGSPKHERDIRAVLAAGVPLDRMELEQRIQDRGLSDLWERVQNN